MPLSDRRPPALLPQAQVQAAPAPVVQRSPEATGFVPGAEAFRSASGATGAAEVIQREAESRWQSARPARRTERERRPRTAMPLAKPPVRSSSAAAQSVVQRKENDGEHREAFVGSSAASGPQFIDGPDRADRSESQGSNAAAREGVSSLSAYVPPDVEAETQDQPDLDLLARAILPLVKRMMALERERRPAW